MGGLILARAYNIRRNTKQDFFKRIHDVNGCHHFQGAPDRDGYKHFQFEGKDWKAHRLAVVFDGRDPTGMVVMHKCDNPQCVNPAHLDIGTHRDNALDRHRKGRSRGNTFSTKKGVTKEML